jgi:ketosteroid isomerase-like protein
MTPDNVEAIRAVYERWAEGDFEAGVHLLDPEVELVMSPDFPDAGTYVGIEGVRSYTRGFLEPWQRITIEAEELTGAGDQVIAGVLQRGVGEGSGIETELRYYHLWSVRAGKVIRLETFRERTLVRAAAGLAE